MCCDILRPAFLRSIHSGPHSYYPISEYSIKKEKALLSKKQGRFAGSAEKN
jgi:hypothetical protein